MARKPRTGASRMPKVGDTYLMRAKVTRVDEFSVTLRIPAYGTPITIPQFSLDDDDVIDEQVLGKK